MPNSRSMNRSLAHYATLTETEIKVLVVEDKWFANIHAAIDGEVQRLTQALTARVQELEETLCTAVARVGARCGHI